MLDAYFCPRLLSRLRAGPDAAHLEAFTAFLHGCGYTRIIICRYVHAADSFFRWLRRRRQPLASATEDVARAFACRRRPARRPRYHTYAALRLLLRQLRAAGVVPPRPVQSPAGIEQVVIEYDAHLRDAAGLAASTRLCRRRYVREFLTSVFATAPPCWERLRPEHVRRFVAGYGQSGRAASAQLAAGALRSFLRWLHLPGHAGADLLAAVPRWPCWRQTPLPTVMTASQRRDFLAAFDRSNPTGRRNYAMALCLVDLGLRAGEVAALTRADLDEAASTLRIAAGKSRRQRVLPLPGRIADALVGYVGRDRPPSSDPHLFLRHRPPVGTGVSAALIRGVVRRAFARVAGCERWTGTHVLRHTAATRLHRAGADLKRVADILGHRSIDTTMRYATVDLERLSAVALPWPATGEGQP